MIYVAADGTLFHVDHLVRVVDRRDPGRPVLRVGSWRQLPGATWTHPDPRVELRNTPLVVCLACKANSITAPCAACRSQGAVFRNGHVPRLTAAHRLRLWTEGRRRHRINVREDPADLTERYAQNLAGFHRRR